MKNFRHAMPHILLLLILSATLALIPSDSFGHGRFPNSFRKLVMSSDLIISSSDNSIQTKAIGDCKTESYCVIDTVNAVLKGPARLKSMPQRASVWTDGEDFFSSATIGIGHYLLDEIVEIDEEYSSLLFLKSEGNGYRLLAKLARITVSDINRHYAPVISELTRIGGMTDKGERYRATMEWFIDNGIYPDHNFVSYYQAEGFIAPEGLKLEGELLEKARKKFLSGKEELLPLVRDAHWDDVRQYYLKRMKRIKQLNHRSYNDYYSFKRAIDALYPDIQHGTLHYRLAYNIMEQALDDYEKNVVLDYFIHLAENDLEICDFPAK